MVIDFAENAKILKLHYAEHGLTDSFEKDSRYLETAFHDINNMWFRNLDRIETVNYLMLAEAPLWGERKKYIYNPETNTSQFFYRRDLENVLNKWIPDKKRLSALVMRSVYW